MRTALLLLLAACAHRPPDDVARRELETFSAPADARAWYLKGLYAEASGDAFEARRAMDWAVRLDRGNPYAWLARARYAERAGDLDAAIADATAAVERAPGLPEAEGVLAALLIRAGRPCEVVARFGSAPVSEPLMAVWQDASSACVASGGSDPSDGSRGGAEE